MAVIVLCNFIPAPTAVILHTTLDLMLGLEPVQSKPPASVPVLQAMAEEGLEGAARKWKSLQEEHAEEYDFSQRQFGKNTAVCHIFHMLAPGIVKGMKNGIFLRVEFQRFNAKFLAQRQVESRRRFHPFAAHKNVSVTVKDKQLATHLIQQTLTCQVIFDVGKAKSRRNSVGP